MASSMSVVIIDSDPVSRKNLEAFLKTVDHVILAGVAEDLAEGYDLVVRTRPMVVIMEVDSNPKQSFEMVEKLVRQQHGLCIFATSSDSSSDNILKSMRSGATEFLLRPVDSKEIVNALKKVGRLIIQQPAAQNVEKGRIITCFAPKGGMGNTTVATNLAVCLHQLTEKSVVVVDLDLEGGDASIFLNLKSKYSISDVTANITRLDRTFLQSVLTRHSTGVYLLAEPQKVEDAEGITPSQVREVLDLLRTMFTFIVVDTEIGYGDRNLAAFDSSDLILITGNLYLPAIRNIQKALDVFDRLGYDPEKVKLVINRYLKKGEITLEDAERTLNYKVFWHLPNDFNNVIASINRGTPLSMVAPHSEISRSFKDLAASTKDYLASAPKAGRA